MGVVFGLGVVTALAGAGNWLGRWRYDRRHQTTSNRMAISRWGFFYPPLRVSVAFFGAGVALAIVGGVGLVA